MLLDGLEGRFVHRAHPWAVVFPRKPGNVALERHGTHRRPEIEESHLSDAEPVGEVSGVGEGRRQTDDPYALVGVR